MHSQRNITHIFVGANAALVATAVPATARYLGIKKVGETLCSAAGAMAAGTRFQFVYLDVNSKVQVSPILDFDNMVHHSRIVPITAAAQLTAIGYNGSSGAIVATNNGKYIITVGYKDSLKQIGNKRLFKYGDYTADSTATQPEIALELAKNLQINFERDAYPRINARAICSAAVTAGHQFDHATTVVHGSKYITVATDLITHDTVHTAAVGDYVRLGSATEADAQTVLTSSVYKIINISSLTLELDRPVTGVSGSYTADTDAELIPAADGLAADWGVILKGNDSDKPFEVGKWAWDTIRFDVGISADFGTTPITASTRPTKGMGTYKEIAQMEWELQANRREPFRIAEYPINFTSNAVSSDTYNFIHTFRFKNNDTETIGGTADSFIEIIIPSCGTTLSDDLETVFTF